MPKRLLRTSPTTGLPFLCFHLGRIASTRGAHDVLGGSGVSALDLLARHARGDWGQIDPGDQGLNEDATVTGARIFSVYKLSAGTVWVITDGDDEAGVRHATTLLLPSEY